MMKQSIRYKLFWIIAIILLFNIFITLLFGNTLMEKFYTNNKKNELLQNYAQLVKDIDQTTTDVATNQPLAEDIFNMEKNNITILILSVTSAETDIKYYSRGNRPLDPMERNRPKSFSPIAHYSPEEWINRAEANGVFAGASLPLLVSDSTQRDIVFKSLSLYGRIDESTYIFLSTPQEPLALAAALGVQYNLYISLATFLLAMIVIYVVSKRFTKPIQDIDQAARHISQMDFSHRCHIHTNDELGALSLSINSMADKLEAYIEQLKLNQILLEKDLAREAKTNEMRKEFITNVSHDFKTPLTLIRAYTESLAQQALPPKERQAYCQIILKETERMTTLVTQLLQLSKLESGIISLEQSLFSIDELIRDIFYNNQILMNERQLRLQIMPQGDYFVYADYSRIEQLLVNLIENAIKYSPIDGEIICDIIPTNHQTYKITITNTCQPLPAQQLEDLFISFYKRDQSRQLDSQNFGLGLAIVKAIITLHQQPYGAINTADGLQFWFELPSVTNL